jgi:tetratricopeptide (TPR) repeat protein
VGKEIAGAVPGGSSAINTLRIREGECGSHSRLLAAFCRAVGIPSRLAVGCLYSPWYGGSFGQHAWTEVYMGENVGWIMVDATILEFDYVDAGHIKLGELTTFYPESMEILEYRIGNEKEVAGIPEEYKEYLGPYIRPDNRNVVEVIYADGSLTLDVIGRMQLALHKADEQGRWYAKLTDKVYLTFDENSLTITEKAYAMKKADVEIDIAEGTPGEMKVLLGPYVISQVNAEFTVVWHDGLKMNVPKVDAPRSLIETEGGMWKDTVDGKVYSFVLKEDGSVSGMNILISTLLIRGFTADFIVDKTLQENGIEAAKEKFRELWNNRALDLEYTEQDMNKLGYKYLGEDKIEEALMVFELNVEAFPKSWNVYDSYGEALMKDGNKEAAIENYNKSMELNPENENGKAMLEKINSEEG